MGLFDRFASSASTFVARAPFFACCLLLVVGWLIGLPIAGPTNQLYHLLLNSPTTAITFLLVALVQNGQARFEKSTNAKLNALADFQADLARRLFPDDPEMARHIAELREAVGIEESVSA